MAAQADYLGKLKKFHRDSRRMPSYAEMAQLFGFASKFAAKYRADQWVERGVLARDSAGKLLPGPSFFPLRVLGTIEAGFPSPAEEENADAISLDEWLMGNREASFMLRVSGDSMVDAGIQPGDMVILERGRTPRSGDIVVAEVDHEWTIKYYEKRGSRVQLKPANRKYRAIVPQEELRVAGVVKAVIRKY
ncbi:transcriptional repressor LexA [Patescibacteria group bacterium]